MHGTYVCSSIAKNVVLGVARILPALKVSLIGSALFVLLFAAAIDHGMNHTFMAMCHPCFVTCHPFSSTSPAPILDSLTSPFFTVLTAFTLPKLMLLLFYNELNRRSLLFTHHSQVSN